MLPESASPRWRPLPEPDQAAPVAMAAYLRAYGPTTSDAFGNWLAGGYFGKRKLHAWFAALEDRLAEVEVDGERRYVLRRGPRRARRDGPLARGATPRPASTSTCSAPARETRTSSRPRTGPPSAGSRLDLAGASSAAASSAGTWELAEDEARIAWFPRVGPPTAGG
jgi:hypothetical protein